MITTLVECECFEGKGNPKIKVSQLIAEQDQMKHDLEERTMRVSKKDAEIAILKVELLKVKTEELDTSLIQELHRENAN